MRSLKMVSVLFVVAAVYDGILGLTFLFAGGPVFAWAGVTPPNHMGYVQFSGALLVVFAIMFAEIAGNPREKKGLIPYGILLKVSYCGVVCFHWIAGGIPLLWKPFAVADVVFILLFAWAYLRVGKSEST